MVSVSMTLSDPWPGFQGHGSFKRRISPKRRILQTQLLYRTLVGNHRQAIDRQASYTAYNPLLLHKPCKRFASVARVCQRQLPFLVSKWLPAAILDFVTGQKWRNGTLRTVHVYHHAKFGDNIWNGDRVIVIFCFSKWRLAAILDYVLCVNWNITLWLFPGHRFQSLCQILCKYMQ